MNYWLIKSPFKTRGWQEVIMSGRFSLYGIRNYQARKNISEMQVGDIALFYHKKAIYGEMQVVCTAYPDPTSSENWLAIDFIPVKTFKEPLEIEELKQNEAFQTVFKQPRLSVVKLGIFEQNIHLFEHNL